MEKIAVLLSTYNGEDYVRQAIQSVLDQGFTEFSFYIVDDCSEDGTWEIIKSFDDPRIKSRRNERNKGLFFNLNSLVTESSSSWIKLIGQDDLLLPNCLAEGLQFAKLNPEVGCFWCYNYTINESLKKTIGHADGHTTLVLSADQADWDTLQWGCLSSNIANLFISRKALASVGPFREDIMSADFDMIVRIQHRFPIARFVAPLVYVRDHDKQWSKSIRHMENHVGGNVEVFRLILDRLATEPTEVNLKDAKHALEARLARCEMNWIIKTLATTGDVGVGWRMFSRLGEIASRRAVLFRWSRTWGRHYGARAVDRIMRRVNIRSRNSVISHVNKN